MIGSPHFFTHDGGHFCPALAVDHDAEGHLLVTADTGGFEHFLDECFG